MAYGTLCRHCGWEETDHRDASGISDEDFLSICKGRESSLQECSGFVSEDPDQEAREYIAEITHWSRTVKFWPGIESRVSLHAEEIGLEFPPSMERVGMDEHEMALSLLGYR